MKRVFKYDLPIVDQQTLMMPVGAHILSVQDQHGTHGCGVPGWKPTLQLWALVDDKLPRVATTIVIVGTGNPVPAVDLVPLGSVITNQGALVWHVFEVIPDELD